MELTNVHLVGVSMGALISATYASKFQDKVNSISLMCIPGGCVWCVCPSYGLHTYIRLYIGGRVLVCIGCGWGMLQVGVCLVCIEK